MRKRKRERIFGRREKMEVEGIILRRRNTEEEEEIWKNSILRG